MTGAAIDGYLSEIEGAIEQAQDCLLRETPEDGLTQAEAEENTLDRVRNCLIKVLPALRLEVFGT